MSIHKTKRPKLRCKEQWRKSRPGNDGTRTTFWFINIKKDSAQIANKDGVFSLCVWFGSKLLTRRDNIKSLHSAKLLAERILLGPIRYDSPCDACSRGCSVHGEMCSHFLPMAGS